MKYSKYKTFCEEHFRKWGIYNADRVEIHCMLVAHESALGKSRRQVGGGPARGLHQIEGDTEGSIWENSDKIKANAAKFGIARSKGKGETDDVYDLFVAAHYVMMDTNPLPKGLEAMAAYCKSYWNRTGKATPEKYLNDYLRWRDDDNASAR
jgi:hypothetical protein